MPSPLEVILSVVKGDIAEISAELASGDLDVAGWRYLMEESVGEAHIASALAAAGTDRLSDLPDELLTKLEGTLDFHLEKLDGFTGELAERGWTDVDLSRAQMYGDGVKTSYSLGGSVVDGAYVDLPAHPGEGSECLVNCHCEWNIETVDAEQGHYDAYWTLGASDHCPTCTSRASEWNPYEIR